jgi:hypothetical protein
MRIVGLVRRIGVPSAVREHNLDADPNKGSFIIGVPPAARSFPQRFARRDMFSDNRPVRRIFSPSRGIGYRVQADKPVA